MFQYRTEKWWLVAMVTCGAARQIFVKVLYQTGFEASNYVTLLYLFGYSLPLIPYILQPWRLDTWRARRAIKPEEGDEEKGETTEQDADLAQSLPKKRIGSNHGLQVDLEKENAARVNRIPFVVQPLILGFLTMANAVLRWASLVYIAASVSMMLVSGMELFLSVVAARLIRRRMVSARRWLGVGVVVLGITLVALSDVLLGDASDTASAVHTSQERAMGIALILGKCLVKMLQDITEEMFMQVGDFPAELLLGLEGAFGLAIALILFFAFGDAMGDGPTHTMATLKENTSFVVGYSIFLTLLFTATGLCNIKATQVTCAMTRNVWKNMRTVLVWIIALLIFYLGNNAALGEAFVVPDSLVILAGFGIMMAGIYVYYSNKAQEEMEAAAQKQAVATESTYLLSDSRTESPTSVAERATE